MHVRDWIPIVLGVAVLSAPAPAQNGPPSTPVSVSAAIEAPIAPSLELVGVVMAKRRSTVAAAAAGIVDELTVDEGNTVAAGDPLARLDAAALRIRIEAAEARKAELEANLRERQSTLERSRSLFEKGRIAGEEFDRDRHGEEALRHAVAGADAAIRVLRDELEKTVVRAPFAGTVTRKHTEVGQRLDVGGDVVDLLDLSRMDVWLDLPERQAGQVDLTQPVAVRTLPYADRVFDGRVIGLIPDADPQAHTLPLKVEVANPDGLLKAGMYARATVALQGRKQALLVSKDALVSRGTARFVFVVRDGAAHQVTVEPGLASAGRVDVAGALEAGEWVVVRGNERLRPMQPVHVTEQLD